MTRTTADNDGQGTGRRGFLLGSMSLGAGALLAACTNKEENNASAQTPAPAAAGAFTEEGKPVKIGISFPGADHGWLAAITANAKAAAGKFKDVELIATEANNTSAEQIGQIETLISRKPDALVILPQEGQALTEVAKKAMVAGIPVINLDRIFSSPLAYRTWVGGDNYGMGVSAGNFIGQNLPNGGNVVEIAGLDSLELTKQRSQGFADALKNYPKVKLVARQAADFTPDTGEKVMANVLQAQKKIDAVWNHDDDQGVGVEAAIKQANRNEFWMVGGAGTKRVMEKIKAGDLFKATVLYSPTMAGTAVNLARLVAQGRALDESVEREVPASITLYSAAVTKENVDKYLGLGF